MALLCWLVVAVFEFAAGAVTGGFAVLDSADAVVSAP